MKVFIIARENSRETVRSIYRWRGHRLIGHLLMKILVFKSIYDIYVIGPKNKELMHVVLDEFNIPDSHFILHKGEDSLPGYLLSAKKEIEQLEDAHFVVFDADIFLSKSEVKKVFQLEILNRQVLFYYRYRIPYPIIIMSATEYYVQGVRRTQYASIEAGAFILSKEILEFLPKSDIMTEAMLELKKFHLQQTKAVEFKEWKHFKRQADLFLEDEDYEPYNSTMDQGHFSGSDPGEGEDIF
jgi:hypothetical protein